MARDHSIECERCGEYADLADLQQAARFYGEEVAGAAEGCGGCREMATEGYVTGYYDAVGFRSTGLDAALTSLARVLSTLAKSAGSPEEQRIWDEARTLLSEHGLVQADPVMVEAYREWEGRR